MIVICKNNGHLFLEKSLNNLSNMCVNIPICIIDTNSSDMCSVDFIEKIKNENIDFTSNKDITLKTLKNN